MLVGISTATYFTKLVTENCFSVIWRNGGKIAEVFLTTYSEFEEDFAHLLNSQKGDVQITSIHALSTAFEPQLFNRAERTRKDAEFFFRKVLRAGQILGAKYYTFHGSTRMKKTQKIDPVFFGNRMKELGDIALEYGITLCLETVHWCAFSTPDFFKVVKEYAPNIGVTLDIKQAWQSEYDWNDYLDIIGDRLKVVHLCDHDADGNICMVGKGVFPFDKLISRLKREGYDGGLIIEQYAKDYSSYDEVGESVKYLNNIIGGIYAH